MQQDYAHISSPSKKKKVLNFLNLMENMQLKIWQLLFMVTLKHQLSFPHNG